MHNFCESREPLLIKYDILKKQKQTIKNDIYLCGPTTGDRTRFLCREWHLGSKCKIDSQCKVFCP